MSKPWFYVLALLCAASLLVSLFWLTSPPAPQNSEPARASYVLQDYGGRLALYRVGQAAPLEVYEVYTYLLPEMDIENLKAGIPLETEDQARRLLEDFGG